MSTNQIKNQFPSLVLVCSCLWENATKWEVKAPRGKLEHTFTFKLGCLCVFPSLCLFDHYMVQKHYEQVSFLDNTMWNIFHTSPVEASSIHGNEGAIPEENRGGHTVHLSSGYAATYLCSGFPPLRQHHLPETLNRAEEKQSCQLQ